MNLLDENVRDDQRTLLRQWRIPFRQVGKEISHAGIHDDNLLPLLHRLKRPTFFTLDHGFYHPALRHQGYCLVFLDVWEDEAAEYIRRLLRHAAFRTQAQRMGKVVCVHHNGVSYWQVNVRKVQDLSW